MADQTKTLNLCVDMLSPNWAPFVRAVDHDGAIAELRAELEQQRTRAEAAEFDLHAERLAHAATLARLTEASRG